MEPLALILRPKKLNDIVGQQHIEFLLFFARVLQLKN